MRGMYRDTADRLLRPAGTDEEELLDALAEMGFVDPVSAKADWLEIVETAGENGLSESLLASLLGVMAHNAAPDTSLRNLRRCLASWDDPSGCRPCQTGSGNRRKMRWAGSSGAKLFGEFGTRNTPV